MGLMCARARIILAVLSGMTSSNLIVFKIVQRRGSGTSIQSVKLWGDFPRKVTPRWYLRFNRSGYFYNTSQRIQETHFGSVEYALGKLFASPFLQNSKNLSPIVGTISMIPVRKSGLGLLNPVTSVIEKYLSS